jgi:hypothetical protein
MHEVLQIDHFMEDSKITVSTVESLNKFNVLFQHGHHRILAWQLIKSNEKKKNHWGQVLPQKTRKSMMLEFTYFTFCLRIMEMKMRLSIKTLLYVIVK